MQKISDILNNQDMTALTQSFQNACSDKEFKEFVGEICTALKSDEWWYTSEMQCDHYEELTIEGIETALKEEEHTVEHAIKRLGGSFKATQLWFEHDTIKHTLLH